MSVRRNYPRCVLRDSCGTAAVGAAGGWPDPGGRNLSTNLSGTVSAGYSADYGNKIDSSHGLSLGGNATASGYYYNPNFVSFNLSPYYGQSRANSNFQSISDSSGVNLSSSIFSGSHFPGSISYAKAYNSQGQFARSRAAELHHPRQ